MKIVIIGAGKVGSAIAKNLSGENHNIIVIDKNREVVENLAHGVDVLGYVGDGVDAEIQRGAGVKGADVVMAVTRHDETNVICCLVAKSLGAKFTVARVREPEYATQFDFFENTLGIDALVNPEAEMAEEIARHLRYPGAEHVETLKSGADIVGVRITADSPLCNLPLRSLGELKLKLLACAVDNGGEVIIPTGNTVLAENDVAYFTGSYQSLDALLRRSRTASVDKIRSIMIIGGSRVAVYLARALTDNGMKVKIIEADRERSEYLADALPKVTVVYGDGSNKQLLAEEGIDLVDSFVTLTDTNEMNVLLSLYAKSRGVDKIVTQINGNFFDDLISTLSLGTVISTHEVMSEGLVKMTRSMQAPEGSNVLALYKIDDKVEAVSFKVGDGSELSGKAIKDLQLKRATLVAGIFRKRDFIVPDGNTVILAGDEVLFVSANYKFKKLDDVLS